MICSRRARAVRRPLVMLAAAGAMSIASAAQGEDDVIVVIGRRETLERPTLQVIQGFREHLSGCLAKTAHLPKGRQVTMSVKLALDGRLSELPKALPGPNGEGELDRDYGAAAHAAREALVACEPYDFLPWDQYDHWKEMVVVFRSAD